MKRLEYNGVPQEAIYKEKWRAVYVDGHENAFVICNGKKHFIRGF